MSVQQSIGSVTPNDCAIGGKATSGRLTERWFGYQVGKTQIPIATDCFNSIQEGGLDFGIQAE